MIEVGRKIEKIEEIKEELSKRAVIAQRLKDAQYSEENLSTVEKIYKYAADHMGAIGCACGKHNLDDPLRQRMNNDMSNPDKVARFNSGKLSLPADLDTCLNNCDLLKEDLLK